MKERVKKFEKFIDETEAKRRRAIHKYQTELKLKAKTPEIVSQIFTSVDPSPHSGSSSNPRVRR